MSKRVWRAGVMGSAWWKRGPLIDPDANVASHVRWRAGSLVDGVIANSWTANGTIPLSNGVGSIPPSAGVFSDVNYYSLGAGNDVLDFAADFTACFVFTPQSGANQFIFSNGLASTGGWALQIDPTSGGRMRFNNYHLGGIDNVTTGAQIVTVGVPNVVCCGRASGEMRLKLNLGTMATGATTAIVAGTALIAKLGRFESGGLPLTAGKIHEAYFTSTTATDALFTALAQQAFSRMKRSP